MNMELEPVQKPEFYPFIESIPNVIECNCVTGNYSMLMKVASRVRLSWMDSSDSSSISERHRHRLYSLHRLPGSI